MSAAVRAPIFETLDAMIAAGYGNVPQRLIPENWRDIPREVREHDLARVRAEELTPKKVRIQAIEDHNMQAAWALVERVIANEAARHGNRRRREEEMRQRQRVLRREAKSRRQREAITQAWSNPLKFQAQKQAGGRRKLA